MATSSRPLWRHHISRITNRASSFDTTRLSAAVRNKRAGLVVASNLPVAMAMAMAMAADAAPGHCKASRPATLARVIELYTSEGCRSCPQADRQLTRMGPDIESRSDAVALAFHADD